MYAGMRAAKERDVGKKVRERTVGAAYMLRETAACPLKKRWLGKDDMRAAARMT